MGFRVSEAVSRGGVNKRAPKACESCRTRKVRCDVTRTGASCTNCRLDNKTCTVPVSKRRHVGDRILGASLISSACDSKSPICDAIIDFGDIQKPLGQSQHPSTTTTTPGEVQDTGFNVFELSTGNVPPSSDLGSLGYDIEMDDFLVDESDLLEQVITAYPSPAQTLCSEQQQPLPILPAYIAALPDHLAPDDVRYLQRRGCFTIPDLEERDRLLQAYTMWVHPFTPMLDLSSIIKAVSGDVTASPVSLLVFQSMMLAASPYCDLFSPGMKDGKDTRKMLYERCKTLHDFGIESDQLSILQSAVLMSFWDGDSGQIRDSYYWIGIATMHSNGMGLYLDPTTGPSTDSRQKVLKRTWWSLMIRDRLLAVALRRPVQNKTTASDVPMLQMDDFEMESLLETVQSNLTIEELNLQTLEVVMGCCMALAQLSEYIDKILSIQYSVQRATGAQTHSNKTISLVPKTSGIRWSDITKSAQELQHWCRHLPKGIQQAESLGQSPAVESRMAHLHKALLAAYYAMTLMTLYRPLLSLSSHKEKEKHIRRTAVKVVFQAAQGITANFSTLYTENLLSFLPETATAALEPAIVTHLLYSTSEVPQVRHHSFQRFYLCWSMLLQLGETYSLADTTVSMINAASQRLKTPTGGRRKSAAKSTFSANQLSSPINFGSLSNIAVPLVNVVGNQRKADLSEGWEQGSFGQTDFMDPLESLDLGNTLGNTGMGGFSDAELFEQLVCWDTEE